MFMFAFLFGFSAKQRSQSLWWPRPTVKIPNLSESQNLDQIQIEYKTKLDCQKLGALIPPGEIVGFVAGFEVTFPAEVSCPGQVMPKSDWKVFDTSYTPKCCVDVFLPDAGFKHGSDIFWFVMINLSTLDTRLQQGKTTYCFKTAWSLQQAGALAYRISKCWMQKVPHRNQFQELSQDQNASNSKRTPPRQSCELVTLPEHHQEVQDIYLVCSDIYLFRRLRRNYIHHL